VHRLLTALGQQEGCGRGIDRGDHPGHLLVPSRDVDADAR
jgi:hypothetical protein